MPKYKVTFSDVSIREMIVDSESEEKLLEDYLLMDGDMLDDVENAVEVDGYYDKDIMIEKL